MKKQYVESSGKKEAPRVKKNNGPKNWYAFLSLPYLLLIAVFIVAPVLIIIGTSFINNDGFFLRITVNEYVKVFRSFKYLIIIRDSLITATVTTLFCLLIGYPCAYFINRLKARHAKLVILLITAPMWINMLLRIVAWKQILEDDGPLNQILSLMNLGPIRILGTETAVIIGSVYIFLPFMILPIYSVLQKMDKSYIEASNDLGAGRVRTFLFITLPMSVTGVLSGIIMVLLPVATTLVIPSALGDNNRYTIGGLIEALFIKNDDWSFGAALSIIVALMILLLVFMAKRIERKVDRR